MALHRIVVWLGRVGRETPQKRQPNPLGGKKSYPLLRGQARCEMIRRRSNIGEELILLDKKED